MIVLLSPLHISVNSEIPSTLLKKIK
jgi:hypothetical protein